MDEIVIYFLRKRRDSVIYKLVSNYDKGCVIDEKDVKIVMDCDREIMKLIKNSMLM